ncbi:Membrane protein [Sphingobium herbicidovorans NBRC 16415]|uniref:Membrane protein n=1 Tax=Sphingobium herbicidovorans (strain ATCC 700291 / DSM 11019 / CCUG 56400 / KCTC 2939 / LMG 18315 / NBRC 16415 / MH) TaxID=1219045 RepID=A0A086PEG8_SPHHM|nr:NfeD family protein [Sphingobium herbicidovorans]KFG91786.1 Membrane protein [Sphingobium herbicidovorans NBRC 16415]
MDWLAMLDDHWGWLVFAALLGMAEVVIPGVFLIWVALAAAVTGLIALVLPVSVPVQLLIFALLCLASVWGGRRWYAANPVSSQDPMLNDRTARLVGEIVTVVEPIDNGRGRVKIGDSVWSCQGPDAPAGARVRVVGADASVLKVELA